ncbi:hypothetical protein SISNIDRAFT_450363 [Sistotremastrum niveocremeum HHB9708]|uniref:Uncharacterized protein n=1 Tax=Sistotremastrum niveocremeum HHB9708 TaxID=1314777 RepID=A0A164Y7F6_9AGAM|nr:hypothetical protein SISNIDRAFT_450363 [Sistotremastrum niveocremeum HHB9708]
MSQLNHEHPLKSEAPSPEDGVSTSQLASPTQDELLPSTTDYSSLVSALMAHKIKTDIESLPNETLCELFKFHYDQSIASFRSELIDFNGLEWWNLMFVSSRWREIIIDTPYFWQEIWTHWHPEIIALCETRSKGHPLTIRRLDRDALHHLLRRDSRGTATAGLLPAHISRLQSLHMEWIVPPVEPRQNLNQFVSRIMGDAIVFPELTQVLLGSYEHRFRPLMEVNAPKLKFLTMQGILLNPTSYPSLANVTFLRIHDHDLSDHRIIPIVEACPRLEFCDIRSDYRDGVMLRIPDPDIEPPPQVPLSALQDLQISGCPGMLVGMILDHFEIPATANIRLVIPPEHPSDSPRQILTPRVSFYDNLHILSGHTFTLSRSTERGSLSLKLGKIYSARSTRLLQVFSFFAVPTSGIHLSSISIVNLPGDQLPQTAEIWTVFCSLPNLEVLRLVECIDINNFLMAFKYDTTTILCPRLRGLDLQDSYYERRSLLECLKERQKLEAVTSIEWIRVVEGFFGGELLSELSSYVGVLIEEPPMTGRKTHQKNW